MRETQNSQSVSTKLGRIAELSRLNPDMVFVSLCHHIDEDLLKSAFERLKKDKASGVDKMTASEYSTGIEERLKCLHARLKARTYRPQPVKRVWIEKDNGKKRPIGILALEDKIVQKAAVLLMEPIYEQDFYDFSYGFRRGRSQHQALKALRERCLNQNINWIVDVDIKGFFDNIGHGWIREFLRLRVKDSSLLRLIDLWLRAQVYEDGRLIDNKKGTPQGGVISPLLANVFLHHVLDKWFKEEIQPKLLGRNVIVRFADDSVIGCEYRSDAEKVLKALIKRFEEFGLEINQEKTKLIPFCNPGKNNLEPGTFNFLGFTHYWGKTRKGGWTIKRLTSGKRLRKTMKEIREWCRQYRHTPIRQQWVILRSKLIGHYKYFAVICNYERMELLYKHTKKAWKHWLESRTRGGEMSWETFEKKILNVYPLPKPKIELDF